MSIPATPQQSHLRDVALAAIAQAHRQMGAGENLVQVDETAFKLEEEKIATRHPSDEQLSAEPGRGSSRGRLVLWSLIGLLAVACIGAFAWPSPHGQAAPEPTSTSSVSIEKPTAPSNAGAKTDAGLPQRSSQAQTTLQRAAPVAPTAAPMAPDLAQSIQMITRELANLEQGIDQLKTGQAQMVRDNAELVLKATQEMARNNADLAEQLKASHEQMANIAEQLKQSQEQIARLVASGQNQRPRTLASSPLPTVNATRKLVPTRPSPRVRVQTQDPTQLQPEQQ
jgi:regulator of replication initiation timing